MNAVTEVDNISWDPDWKTYVFIDNTNFSASMRALGNKKSDFLKLKAYLLDEMNVMQLYHYSLVIRDGEGFDSLHPVTTWLGYNGFTIKRKEVRPSPGRGRGSMNMDLAVDAMELAATGKMEHAVLFAGDEDLVRLVEALQRQAIHVTVISGHKTDGGPTVSDALRRQANTFVDLAVLYKEFERVDGPGQSLPDSLTSD